MINSYDNEIIKSVCDQIAVMLNYHQTFTDKRSCADATYTEYR